MQLRSHARERRMDEAPDLVQWAPRVNRETEQILLNFLGLEPDARRDLWKKLVRRSVHREQLS